MIDITVCYFKTPYGELVLGAYQDKLCLCDWRYRKMRDSIDKRICRYLDAQFIEGTSDVLEQTIKQLDEYFQHQRQVFSIPLLLLGTDFQKQVWQALIALPFSKTNSYLELAKSMGNEKAVRAVASANAIAIIVPCHLLLAAMVSLWDMQGVLRRNKNCYYWSKIYLIWSESFIEL